VAYKDAFTARTPVHMVNKTGGNRYPSGYEVMHRIVWELMPDLYGNFAGRLQGDPGGGLWHVEPRGDVSRRSRAGC
jgi:hypothetical protein